MTREEFTKLMDSRLKLVRTEFGLTQDKMALALGISKKTLVEIEKGRRTLGWTGAVACGTIFGTSTILQNDFGGELTDLLRSLGLDDLSPAYPKTMGGKVWWTYVEGQNGWRIQKNLISGHYRLLDPNDGRVISSFDRDIVHTRLGQEMSGRQKQ